MRCAARTRSGSRCENRALPGSDKCGVHRRTTGVSEIQPRSGLRFKNALYYPFIEIRSERWLKTAALYWDTVSTIVPEGIRPYTSEAASVFHAAGILEPVVVAPDVDEVEGVADDVLLYLDSSEGRQLLDTASTSERVGIHVAKFAENLRWEGVHRGKMTERLHQTLHDLGVARRRHNSWAQVPEPFAHFYMTVLATRVAEQRGKALVTDAIEAEPLAERVFRGDRPPNRRGRGRVPGRTAEGLLACLALRTVDIRPDTTATKIIRFREKHQVEVGRFRTAIRNLAKEFTRDVGVEALRSHVDTTYSDEVAPAMDELRGRLRDNRISCGFSNLRLSTLMSASPTALGVALSGTPFGPFALVAGVGLSVVLSVGNYRIQRRSLLRGNPYSYVLAAEKAFGEHAVRSKRRRHN